MSPGSKVADLGVQRHQFFDQLVLRTRGYAVLFHGQDEVLSQGIELGVRHVHIGVAFAHSAPGIGARPTTEFAELVRQVGVELAHVNATKLIVDTLVFDNPVEQVFDDIGNAGTLPKLLIERSILLTGFNHGLATGEDQQGQQNHDDDGMFHSILPGCQKLACSDR
ncbi:hypothetical protein MARINON1_50717 [Marinobacter salarius]|nr:hypothetical protein MBHK15_130893 [Marinobacter salarius]VXB55210.1 hypothetical protein MARINON1_50717 [Marinobacter salarius]